MSSENSIQTIKPGVRIALLAFIIALHLSAGTSNSSNSILIREHFSETDSILHTSVTFPDAQLGSKVNSRFDDGVFDAYTAMRNDSIIELALVDSVRSKSSYITFMVILSPQKKILSLKLLSTPDPISSKLRSPSWLKQFTGKTQLRVSNVDAVSGATISSRDITEGIIRLLKHLRSAELIQPTNPGQGDGCD